MGGDAVAVVTGWASGLGELANVGTSLAALAAPGIEAAARASAASGTTPSGAPWAPKRDGGQPLANAAGEISVSSNGAAVVVSLNGPSAIHHNGEANGPRRQVIPDDGEIPQAYDAAVDEALVAALAGAG